MSPMSNRGIRRALLVVGVFVVQLPGVCSCPAATPHVVFLIGEREYETRKTLPAFARDVLIRQLKYRCSFVHADPKDGNSFPGIQAIKNADLLVLSVRRRALPAPDLAVVRQHLAAGRPLLGIRTASHAFDTRGKHPAGHQEWQKFDPEVLGGHYVGHHGNKLVTTVQVLPSAKSHPILEGVDGKPFAVGGSLYRVNPLKKSCVALLSGRVDGKPVEPVAWTHSYRGGRVFYTSLGHPKDFQLPAFRRMLRNAFVWSLGKKPGAKKPDGDKPTAAKTPARVFSGPQVEEVLPKFTAERVFDGDPMGRQVRGRPARKGHANEEERSFALPGVLRRGQVEPSA
ncbi:MAG: ThuA domain-containing protein [Planctomycetaceae bacterium]|nr:ThuA domain-containing protein [Planctomycetaceae bacterium]